MNFNAEETYMADASDVISEYRASKKKMEELAAVARESMQERYTVLLAEAATIRSEFYANFGTYPTLPSTVKAFAVGSSSATKKPPTEAMTTGKMIGGLRRSLNAAIKRGDTAKTAQITKQLATLGVGTVAGESPAPSESAPKE